MDVFLEGRNRLSRVERNRRADESRVDVTAVMRIQSVWSTIRFRLPPLPQAPTMPIRKTDLESDV